MYRQLVLKHGFYLLTPSYGPADRALFTKDFFYIVFFGQCNVLFLACNLIEHGFSFLRLTFSPALLTECSLVDIAISSIYRQTAMNSLLNDVLDV